MYIKNLISLASDILKPITESDWKSIDRRSVTFDQFLDETISIKESVRPGISYLYFVSPSNKSDYYYSIDNSDIEKFIDLINHHRFYKSVLIPRPIYLGKELTTGLLYISLVDNTPKYNKGFASLKIKVRKENLNKAVEYLYQLIYKSEEIEVMED